MKSQRLTDSRLANIGARTIHQAFETYHNQFEAITGQAKGRFEKQDWLGLQEDTAQRLGLYRRIVALVESAVRDLLEDRLHNKLIWASMKAVYSGLFIDNDNWELAETSYDSITRRIFTTVGVDPQIEFVATDFETPPTPSKTSVYRTYRRAPYTAELVEHIIKDFDFDAPFADLSRDAQLVADQIKRELLRLGALRTVERAEIVKHGKTELYRDLLHHLAYSDDQFEAALGQRGMVMMVFDMPSYDMVFKLIKDHFNYPKNATRKDVMAKYDLVHRHDRAGRLVDAQAFEYLEFEKRRFSTELLAELQAVASETVSVEDEYVIVKHAYVERRVIPLDIYVREAADSAACSAVMDYGRVIKDLANSKIFLGDMLLKNFGVTRHGRVIFYDYDELCFLLECNFRRLPPASSYDDELAAEPWFHVNEGDIFPEEFAHFLGLSGTLRDLFSRYHGELFTAAYWRGVQDRLNAGEIMHIFPYRRSQRLHV